MTADDHDQAGEPADRVLDVRSLPLLRLLAASSGALAHAARRAAADTRDSDQQYAAFGNAP